MQLADRLGSDWEQFFYWTHLCRCLCNPCDGNGASFRNTTFRSSDKVQKSRSVLSKSFILCALRLCTNTRHTIKQSTGTALLHLSFLLLPVIYKITHPDTVLCSFPSFFCFEPTLLYNLHVCTVHQWWLKHFIIQQMHKYIIRSASLDSAEHTSTMGKYAAITPTTSMSTDTIEPLL